MADNFFKKVDFKDYSDSAIQVRLDNMLSSLNDVFSASTSKNGTPIYSVWIKFALGSESPIYFDTTSTIAEQNLIASLRMTKGQNGYANDFTLEIYYDAFKSGQETNVTTVEKLDKWVADAMSLDYNTADDGFLTGRIQYGYNNLDDVDRQLCTPVYSFYVTDATSETSFNSGITHYTFSGCAYIASDINFTTNIPKQEGRPLDVVKNVLTKYYSPLGYEIDISQEDINAQQADNMEPKEPTTSNPWQYCNEILDIYPLTQAEKDSGKYTDEKLAEMKEGDKPRYVMYITEVDNNKKIHIKHCNYTYEKSKKLKYRFEWTNTRNNLVTGWTPQADLKTYLIKYASYIRNNVGYRTSNMDKLFLINHTQSELDKIVAEKTSALKNEQVPEYYDATLECIGIPTDFPVGSYVEIVPTLFQTVSRTRGLYMIRGAEDTISTNGIFKTTITLFRSSNLGTYMTIGNTYTAGGEMIVANNTSTKQTYSFLEGGGNRKWRRKCWRQVIFKKLGELNEYIK